MSLIAPLVDGKFDTETTSSASLNKEKKTGSASAVDSEAFLTLLVAEMQNQDPLEPTSNTEWVSQYATFTQVAEIQSIGDAMNGVQAQGLVGKNVIMKVTDSTGNTDYIDGMVERVGYQENKAYLYIDGEPYSIDDLDTVVSDEYMAAVEQADEVAARMKELPGVALATADDVEEIVSISQLINGMSDYEKGFLEEGAIDTMKEYMTRATAIVKEQQEAAEAEAKAKEEAAAKTAAQAVADALATLPSADKISLGDEETIMTLHDTVEAMSTFQKGYVGEENLKAVENYYYRLKDLKNGD
ncbi:MAG: hypothetical protein IJ600_03895 [Lachnospiraceae bacterium]|nr:hypothetical protein [Lachnospiraceae bacterium]